MTIPTNRTTPHDIDEILERVRELIGDRDGAVHAIVVVEPDVDGLYHVFAWRTDRGDGPACPE